MHVANLVYKTSTKKLTSNFDIHVLRKHDILALEVSMHDIHRVTVGDTSCDAPHHVACLGLWQNPAIVDVVKEIAVLSHLEHEIDLARSLDKAVDLEDVVVVEALNSVHLARKKFGEQFSRGTFFLEDLDGNLQNQREKKIRELA